MSFFTFSPTMLAWLSLAVLSTPAAAFTVMPAGASVTFGVGSTTGNSYRFDLQSLLAASNIDITYVGARKNGNFSNNAVEATSGFVIGQIAAAVRKDAPNIKPEMLLLDAGTNNCNGGGTVPDGGKNISALISDMFMMSPGSTVIMTTILRNSVKKQDDCRVDLNKQITSEVENLQAQGKKVVLVDMRGPGGPEVTDLADGRHPNDVGYGKMANIWMGGVMEAVKKGFVGGGGNGTAAAGGQSEGGTEMGNGMSEGGKEMGNGMSEGGKAMGNSTSMAGNGGKMSAAKANPTTPTTAAAAAASSASPSEMSMSMSMNMNMSMSSSSSLTDVLSNGYYLMGLAGLSSLSLLGSGIY